MKSKKGFMEAIYLVVFIVVLGIGILLDAGVSKWQLTKHSVRDVNSLIAKEVKIKFAADEKTGRTASLVQNFVRSEECRTNVKNALSMDNDDEQWLINTCIDWGNITITVDAVTAHSFEIVTPYTAYLYTVNHDGVSEGGRISMTLKSKYVSTFEAPSDFR